jgi:hypothetical protein
MGFHPFPFERLRQAISKLPVIAVPLDTNFLHGLVLNSLINECYLHVEANAHMFGG